MEQALCQLDCCRHCATQVRNNFAHNLNKKIDLLSHRQIVKNEKLLEEILKDSIKIYGL